MKLHIKYMVSQRCKILVHAELDKLGLSYRSIELGEVDMKENITVKKRSQLETALLKSGLELMDDKKSILIGKIKTVIINVVHYTDKMPHVNYSEYLSKKLHQDYSSLSSLFSSVTGTTIEQYIIAHKIERVKELLLYDELSLTEISYMMDYSSVSHLSTQFKKITGLTPTFFKKLKQYKKRIVLESV